MKTKRPVVAPLSPCCTFRDQINKDEDDDDEKLMSRLKNTHFILFPEALKDYYKENNFKDHIHSDLVLSKTDYHPSVKGHYMKAKLIYDDLVKSGILNSLMSNAFHSSVNKFELR